MEAKAVVIRVSQSAEFGKVGKVGKVVAEVESLFLADAMATGLQRMQHRGEMKSDIGFIYCGIDRINHVASSCGFVLES